MKNRLSEEKIFKIWIASQSEVSFEDFKKKMEEDSEIRQEQVINSKKDTTEILIDVKNILNKMGGTNATI